jgi:hypothetical protein
MQNKPNFIRLRRIQKCFNFSNNNNYELRTTNYELFKNKPKQSQNKPNFTRLRRANPIYGERVEPPVVSLSNHFSHLIFLLKSAAGLHLSPCYDNT